MSHAENFEKCCEEVDKEVMLKIIQNLGKNIDEVQYNFSKHVTIVMSTARYIDVKFKNKTTGENEEFSIVLKRSPRIEFVRQFHVDCQFHNEILFYRMYAQPNENFAKCFYFDEQPPTDSVIAVENVNGRGYYSCPYTYNAPLEYTLAAMREMGRFHGKGYVMKKLQHEKFFDIVKQIQEVRYDRTYDDLKVYINRIAPRAVEYLRNHSHDVTFCDKMEAVLSEAFDKVMMKTAEPREPLSTLCHGDFTLNNTLFKSQDDGQYQAMLIDFALFRYSTPVVDLSTYLCLCCSNEIREDKFFEIIRAYHNALKEYLLEADLWDAEKYSYDVLLDDFKRGCLFGFVIASYYLPILMGYSTCTLEEFGNETMDKRAETEKQFGGDEMSQILADMLLHLRDNDCLKYFL